MVDVLKETVITLADAGRRLGRSRAVIRLWVNRGCLDAVRLAGRPYTSVEALARMAKPIPKSRPRKPQPERTP